MLSAIRTTSSVERLHGFPNTEGNRREAAAELGPPKCVAHEKPYTQPLMVSSRQNVSWKKTNCRRTGTRLACASSTKVILIRTPGLGERLHSSGSAQDSFEPRRRFCYGMLPNARAEAYQSLPSVHVRDRAESPRTARVHLWFWLDWDSQVGIESPSIEALAIEHIARARS